MISSSHSYPCWEPSKINCGTPFVSKTFAIINRIYSSNSAKLEQYFVAFWAFASILVAMNVWHTHEAPSTTADAMSPKNGSNDKILLVAAKIKN